MSEQLGQAKRIRLPVIYLETPFSLPRRFPRIVIAAIHKRRSRELFLTEVRSAWMHHDYDCSFIHSKFSTQG